MRAWQYNGNDRLSNGGCCDGEDFWGDCRGCEPSFVFCLRGSPTSRNSDTDYCPLGRFISGRIGNRNAMFGTPHLRSGDPVPNPMPFVGQSALPVSFNWLVT